jgi:hypothetical protein
MAIVRLEGLGQLKKIQCPHLESNPRHSSCSIVPQPTSLPRVHVEKELDFIICLAELQEKQLANSGLAI